MALNDSAVLKRLQDQLDERAAELRAESGMLQSELSDAREQRPGGDVADAGEQAEERARIEVRSGEERRDARELVEIDQARQRIADGRYGECVVCGREIPLPRLQARPAAARCLACQERFEAQAAAAPPA